MATPGRRRVIAGGIASAAVAGAIGATVLVAHGSSPAAAAQAASLATTTTSTAAASPVPGKAARHHPAGAMVIGRVASVTSSTLTVVDAKGVTHTLSVVAKTRVTGPGGAEAVTSIPAGELVIVDARSPHPKAASGTSASSSTSTSSGTSPVATDLVAAAIRDTGFKAA